VVLPDDASLVELGVDARDKLLMSKDDISTPADRLDTSPHPDRPGWFAIAGLLGDLIYGGWIADAEHRQLFRCIWVRSIYSSKADHAGCARTTRC
jgi:hypothetical protein